MKSSVKILELIAAKPDVTAPEIAEALHLTKRAVEKQIAKLRTDGCLRRVGPDKGGRWAVL